jgi:N-acetylglucosamine-6-sulfatase
MPTVSHKSPKQTLRALVVAAALACVLAAALTATRGPAPAGAATKPNIVVFQTDDMTRFDLYTTFTDPLTGAPNAVMGNTLALIANAGVSFNRYYVSNPLCCPSRAAMLTGRYSHNNLMLTNFFPSGGYYQLDKQNNVARWLNAAGYRTSHVGKFLNEYGEQDPTEVPPGWDDWHTVIGDARLFYGYKTNDNGTVSEPHGEYDEAAQSYPERDAASCPDDPGPGPLAECNYLTDVITRDAINAIDTFGTAAPIFLQVDYTTPHGDIVPPGGPEPATRHAGMFAGAIAPRVPGFNEKDMSDKPSFVRANPRLGFGKTDYVDRRYAQRPEALRAVDEGIGRIISRLAATGQLANTYIVFTSDNGFFQGEHRFDAAKFLPYEPSNHMPLIISGPGLEPGAKRGELVANVDIAPTLLEISGASATASIDGRSLLRFARDPAQRTRRPILLEGFTGKGEAGVPLRATASIRASPRDYEGIRIGPYKYIEYRSGAKELYDMRRDKWEQHSRHIDPRYRLVKRWLAARLARLEGCVAKSCKKGLKAKLPQPLKKGQRIPR